MKSRRNLPALSIAHSAPAPAIPVSYEQSGGQEEGSPGLSMPQIATILRAYWKQTLIIALTVTLLMAGLVKALPKTYTATTTLMVNPAGNDTLGNNNQASTPLFNYMSTESQLMTSVEVLLPVIDKLKLTQNPTYAGGYSGDGSTIRDYVRENLVKTIEVQLGAFASQLIYVTVSAETPEMAAKIANTLADVYLGQQRGRVSGPASDRAKRYALELAELKDKVRVAQDQVTAFRQRTGVTDTTAKSNNVEQALLGSLESRLQDASNARRAAEVKAAEQQSNSSAMASMSVSTIRATLATQQAQLAQLQTTYGAAHPKVLELQNQIKATQRNLDAELHNATSSNSSDLVAAQQLEAKMRIAVEEQRNKVLGVNKLQDEGTKFELELESAQSVYKRALDGYDQIMFASGSQVANIGIVSAAVPPQKAAKPNKPRLLIMGVLLGLVAGVIGPLLYELLFNRRVRCRDDFERDMQLPVLMEFDRILPAHGAAL